MRIFRKTPKKLGIRDEKGVALIMALMSLTLLMWISVELSYDTSVDYVVASNQVNQVKAFYAAKSGVELSLLRIRLYKVAMESLGSQLGDQKKMLDLIWSFPMMWPPQIPEDANVTEVDQSAIKKVVGESLMDAQYSTTITSEGSRIDVNDLGSEIETLANGTKQQLLKIFETEMDRNDDFRKKHSGVNFEELVNNIADYVDEDKEGRNGGDETSLYRDFPRTDDTEMPPNRSFITIDEINMVAGMTDDFYELLLPRITVFGVKGFNVNHASKESFMLLDPTMNEEAVNAVLKRISDPNEGGPFPVEGCKKAFLDFISGYGVDVRNLEASTLPFLCDSEVNFRIESAGFYIRSQKQITAITYDMGNIVGRYTDMLQKQIEDEEPPESDERPEAGIKASKDRPSVVYWMEN